MEEIKGRQEAQRWLNIVRSKAHGDTQKQLAQPDKWVKTKVTDYPDSKYYIKSSYIYEGVENK